jgi:hypothetical protein
MECVVSERKREVCGEKEVKRWCVCYKKKEMERLGLE